MGAGIMYQVHLVPGKKDSRMGKPHAADGNSAQKQWKVGKSVCKPRHTGSQIENRPPQGVYKLEHLLRHTHVSRALRGNGIFLHIPISLKNYLAFTLVLIILTLHLYVSSSSP